MVGHLSPTRGTRPAGHCHNRQWGLGDRQSRLGNCQPHRRHLVSRHKGRRHPEHHGQNADQWKRTVPMSGRSQLA